MQAAQHSCSCANCFCSYMIFPWGSAARSGFGLMTRTSHFVHATALLCCTLGSVLCGCLNLRHCVWQGLVTSSATAAALERRAAARAAAETSSSRSSAQQPQRQPPGSATCDGLFATSGECSVKVACIIVRRKSFPTLLCLTLTAYMSC